MQDVDLGNQANSQMIMAGSGIFNLKQLHTARTYRTTYLFDPNFSVMLLSDFHIPDILTGGMGLLSS